MEIIQIPGYVEFEKLEIAKAHLVDKVRTDNGLSDEQLDFTEGAILEVIRHYTRESGVRGLERELASIARKVAREVVSEGEEFTPARITPKRVRKYLGVQRHRFGQTEPENRVGVTTGLAYTEVGGELLQTEVAVTPGKGKLQITGRLGEVMQESANAAMTYIRSRAKQLGLTSDFHTKVDVHIHVPDGGTPKDGPSAGITLATTIASALTRIAVRSNVAMTGEITLRGRVLPIGGLKEKLIAAHRGGIDTVLVPKDNEKDLKDLPPILKKNLTLIPVEHMDEVLRLALDVPNPDQFLEEEDGIHEIEEIYIAASGLKRPTTELPHPAGPN
jgi:ATP-dependent Lon protease